MPRKPKAEKKSITVVLEGVPVTVILHPPADARKSWYAYWNGLVAGKSTGRPGLDDAVVVAEQMVRSWKAGGDAARPTPVDAVLTDEEFEQVQREYYGRKKDPAAARRAAKSLVSCLEAIDAFRRVSGLRAAAAATPDDCASFQRKALELPRNWRSKHPKSREDPGLVSPSTVVKWCVALRAAFERVNRNGAGKCVRGVVDAKKLLERNPWKEIPWIEGNERKIRQFTADELVGLVDHLEEKWAGVAVAPAVAKVLLWSAARREEVMALTWEQHRPISGEHHFDVVGKWGVRRWFRVPDGLYADLEALRVEGSPHVFAAYNAQLRRFYAAGGRPGTAKVVAEAFDPVSLGDWFYNRLTAWAKGLAGGHAYIHVFRKTALQFAREGEDANRRVAEDARVGEAVLLGHYVTEKDEQLRAKSNRTFGRLAAALPPAVASRYGYEPPQIDLLAERVAAAARAGNLDEAARLIARARRLQNRSRQAAG
jgi:integrase